MTYIVYGDPGSGSSTVELALTAIGARYEIRDVPLDDDAQRGGDYAAVNPARKLPALVTPQGETLTESLCILLTLDERHREAALMQPPGSVERARALRWLCFVATELYPLVEINDYPERFAPEGTDPAAVRERARAMWRERWPIVEGGIEGDPWLLPSAMTLADIYIAAVSRWVQKDEWRPATLPRIERIARAIGQHPVLAGTWARHFA